MEFEKIQARGIDTTFNTAETLYKLHRAAQSNDNSNYFAASRAGRDNSYSNIIPNLELVGTSSDNMSIECKQALREDSFRNAQNLQQQVNEQLLQLWNNRDGATYANPQTRARLEAQLENTLQRASACGVDIELRVPHLK